MKRYLFFMPLIILLMQPGCLFDSEDGKTTEIKDAGSYSLSITTPYKDGVPFDAISVTPGSPYILFITLHPDEDFAGSVKLSIADTLCFRSEFLRSDLTLEQPFTELTIYTDSTIVTWTEYDLVVRSMHANVTRTDSVTASTNGMHSGSSPNLRNSFIEWLLLKYPSLIISIENEWLNYAFFPGIAGSGNYVTFTEEWIIVQRIYIEPPFISFSLLRKRGEVEPIAAAGYIYSQQLWREFSPLEWNNTSEIYDEWQQEIYP